MPWHRSSALRCWTSVLFPFCRVALNRNVRSFITLYGADFSFVDPRDLPPGKVESVTLVDTQSLVTLKGMGAKTTVRVVDHHPLRPGLPDDWQVTIDEIGATTTLLVEAMQVEMDTFRPSRQHCCCWVFMKIPAR